MQFSRQENFEGLSELANQAEERGYNDFAEYCRLREKGSREDALRAIGQFVSEMRSRSGRERQELADWLLTFCFENPQVYDACPMPLKQAVIAPAIDEWIKAEPENMKALRWSPDERALMVAARAVPREEIAVGRFAMVVIQRVDYATHELPSGYLGISLQRDLADVQTAIDLLHTVSEAEFFHTLREEGLRLKMRIQKYLPKG
jgi:hypothetical protein